jgi:hypothetical protein
MQIRVLKSFSLILVSFEKHKRMVEFRNRHYTDLSKPDKLKEEEDTDEFHFPET